MTSGMTFLGDVVNVVDCEHRTAPRADDADRFGYSVGTPNLRHGRISLETAKPVTRETFESWTRRALPRPGDLIFSREAPMGEVGEVPIDVPVCLGQRTVLLQPRETVNQRYLKYLLMAPYAQRWISDNSAGTTVLHLNVADVRRIPLGALPALDQQERIVDLLDDHMSMLDAGAGHLRRGQRRLQALHKSVLLGVLPDVTEYPTSWRRSTVQEAGKVELGRQRHPDWHNGPNMRPYLRVANVFEDRIDTSSLYEMHWPEGVFEKFRLLPGDVLLNEGQSPEFLGRPALYRGVPEDVAFTNSLIRFKANNDVLPEFALLVFRRHMHAGRFTQEARITTNIAHLSAARLKPIEFPVPPVSVQADLVATAEARLSAVRHLRAELRASQLRLKSLRRTLLGAAFADPSLLALEGPRV